MHQGYGGLKGDLAIFLALIALSMDPRVKHGRTNQRGVVVYVYMVPSTWDSTSRSTAKELERYQDGVYGKYYP
ncbi:hypothetical protein SLS60_010518 [Paraconiothyrium brasiliense]|uniref:Uncharacterized protein n=1 Tax=Paraconiothyrium brasiliense TaxID=300254 RepID=A0ABR3QNQ8_9PLEO